MLCWAPQSMHTDYRVQCATSSHRVTRSQRGPSVQLWSNMNAEPRSHTDKSSRGGPGGSPRVLYSTQQGADSQLPPHRLEMPSQHGSVPQDEAAQGTGDSPILRGPTRCNASGMLDSDSSVGQSEVTPKPLWQRRLQQLS